MDLHYLGNEAHIWRDGLVASDVTTLSGQYSGLNTKGGRRTRKQKGGRWPARSSGPKKKGTKKKANKKKRKNKSKKKKKRRRKRRR